MKIFGKNSLKNFQKNYAWKKKENLHITLLFVGFFPEEKISNTIKELQKIEFEQFEVELQGLGSFGNRVLWLGVSIGSNELKKLNFSLRKTLKIDDKIFHAHITLARNKKLSKKEIDKLIQEMPTEFRELFTVKSFELMESKFSPKGSEYSIVKSFPLKSKIKKDNLEFQSASDLS